MLYESCYETVYKTKGDSLLRVKDAKQRVEQAASDAGCSLRLYILTNMIGYREASPDRKFYANMLFGDRANHRLELYRSVCVQKYGTFDLEAIDTLLGKEKTSDAEKQMLNSEIIAGSFIVGYKIRSSGDPAPMLFNMQELSLSPIWLATDACYVETILTPHLNEPTGTPMVQRHRFSVCQTLKELKRSNRRAQYVFKTKERMMPIAVKTVLNQHGFSPSDFEIATETVDDSFEFWRRIGYAIQQYWTLEYYNSRNEVFLKKVM